MIFIAGGLGTSPTMEFKARRLTHALLCSSIGYWNGPRLRSVAVRTRGVQRRDHELVSVVRRLDLCVKCVLRRLHLLQGMVSGHATDRLGSERQLTLHPRATFCALRQARPGVVIHGRKYHSAVLIIVESGVIYCIALVNQNMLPTIGTH